MLVVPDHWGEAPIRAGTPFAAKLRRWAEAGNEIFLHGWFHKDVADHQGALAGFKARHMTAGEGEFLGLPREEAVRRMTEGRALVQDITGTPIAGFIAPAWLYGDGARAALSDTGMRLAEDHMKVWSPSSGAILCRGPVITWASRSRGRIASSLAAAAALRHASPFMRVMRVGVHPGDVTVPALIASIDLTMQRLAQACRPARYGELAEVRACAS